MEQKQNQPEAQFEWVRPKEGTPEIYGNFSNFSWTLFDVRVQIGQLIPKGSHPTLGFVVEERGAVTMAWPEVKILRDVLADLVDRYEKVNGEIKPLTLPPSEPNVP